MISAFAVLAAVQAVPAVPEDTAYFQQDVEYTLEARLDEEREALVGAGVLDYRNNSPEPLDSLYFHLYLNAFRPNSVWAENEQRDAYDFQALEELETGFHRMRSMAAGGARLEPVYPHAPDSTVVAYALPSTLEPGGAVTLAFEWEARPSTLCRRQCRRGRSYDFAHWYPRIAVFDHTGWAVRPLYPQGELYGEFGNYHVTFDLADDQVIGATGVPVAGDPGWRVGPYSPDSVPHYRRDFYGHAAPTAEPGLLDGPVEEGRKRVIFHAEQVHHFAWATSPDYRYEAGRSGDIAVHVLFRPGDLDWDMGAAVDRTIRALEWLEGRFGSYPWPQLTNLHRLEDGGTEFPMVLMDGSSGQGLIIHEAAHQYAHGIFGNNEWREGWLDEGMASFLSAWFYEDLGAPDPWSGLMRGVGRAIADGPVAPISTESQDFPDYGTYGLMTYSLPQAVLYSLRKMLGDELFADGLRDYYLTKALEHVTEDDLRRSMERASGRDLGWFFEQWFHTTGTLDYAVGDVSQTRTDDGWRTTVEVVRRGENWMPITVRVGDAESRLEGPDERQTVVVTSSERPERVVLDPNAELVDVDRTNDTVEIPAPGAGASGGPSSQP
ncbi:MAG: M1 family metallopeptidase [Gemmatimonadota bacterium]